MSNGDNAAVDLNLTPISIEKPIDAPPYPQYPNLRPKHWQPGQSGNPKGRPATSDYIDKLLPADKRAERLVTLALQSDNLSVALGATKETIDRTDGPTITRVDIHKTQMSIDFNELFDSMQSIKEIEQAITVYNGNSDDKSTT